MLGEKPFEEIETGLGPDRAVSTRRGPPPTSKPLAIHDGVVVVLFDFQA
jgi:hypothetical protein